MGLMPRLVCGLILVLGVFARAGHSESLGDAARKERARRGREAPPKPPAASPQSDDEAERERRAACASRPAMDIPCVVRKPRVMYPPRARAEGVGGEVRLSVLVGKDGKVDDVLVMRGADARLVEEATRAARAMVYDPARKDGKPVEQWTNLSVTF